MFGAETTERDNPTVAVGDIARLANVGKPAVSNWRRRFPDFPTPIGGSSASPLYSLSEVTAWLTRYGKPFQVKPSDKVWQRIRGVADDLQLGDLVGYLGTLLVLRQRQPTAWKALAEQPEETNVAELARAVQAAVPELRGLVTDPPYQEVVGLARLIAEAADQEGHREVFDFLCDRYLEVHSRRYTAIPQPVAALMVSLAGVTGRSVLDPACGIGTLLLAALASGATELHGQEVNPTAALLAAVRLLLQDRPSQVVAGDSLRQDAFANHPVDAVLCNPPFGERSWGYEELTGDPRWRHGLPPRSESELAWVQHCLARVKPGGRVVITMPAAVAARRAGRRIRSNLLRSGALRAVITLPATGPAGSGGPDLWVLERAEVSHHTHVLMVDASRDLSLVEPAWQAFLADPATAPPGPSRSVRIIDLLDEEIDVSPLRYLAANGRDTVSVRYQPVRASMVSTTTSLAATVPDLAVPDVPESLPMTTVNELVRAGAIVVRQAPIRMDLSDGRIPVLTVQDVRRGRKSSGTAMEEPGSVTLQTGDVVTPIAARDAAVRVITSGGALLGPQLLLFRVDPDRIDPYFLAGFLRIAQAQSPSARGQSLSPRSDLRRAPIPRMPLPEQREYGEAFQRLMAFEAKVREAATLGEHLIELGFAGLADGSLRPPVSSR